MSQVHEPTPGSTQAGATATMPRRTVRWLRNPGGWWLAALLLVPLLFALLTPRGGDDQPASTAGPSTPATDSATPGAPPAPGAETLQITRVDQEVVVAGVVGADTERAALLDAARTANPGATVVDKVTVTAGRTAPSATSVAAALNGARDVKGLALSASAGAVTLRGLVTDQPAAQAIEASVKQAFPEARIDNQLTYLGRQEAVLAAATCEGLQQTVATSLKASPILFSTAGSTVGDSSRSMLTAVGRKLVECRKTGIEVSGHTDATGSAAVNQPLSQRRAEAVRQVLVESGVAKEAVTAKGYGSSKPVSGEDDAAGRALNRRVEIAFP